MRALVVSVAVAFGVASACASYTTATDPGERADGGAGGDAGACESTCPANACGLIPSACGPLDCGACGPSERCVEGRCACVPKSCADLKASCGAVPDGCGGQIYCGECAGSGIVDAGADAADGGARGLYCGAQNACTTAPCVPGKASEVCFSPTSRLCGKHSDGCGGLVDCGTSACSGVGETCGGGGKAGICGCKPLPSCIGNCYSNCSDGCGGTRRCNCNNCH